MTALDILEDIELLGNKRNDKIALLKKHSDNEQLKWILGITYDYRITFGITTRPYKVANPQTMSMDNWKDFIRLLHLYRNRDLTGNAAKDAWKEFFEQCEDGERKWYTRVLNRDLKCGVSVKTINAAWPGYLKTFGVMLAQTYKPKKLDLKFPIAVEPKLDGMRVLVVVSDKPKAYSRDGRELPTLAYLAQECSDIAGAKCVFDGEIFSTNWNETMHLVKTEKLSKKDREKLTYHVFDIVGYEEFSTGKDSSPYHERRDKLESLSFEGTHVKLVEVDYASDILHILTLYNKALKEEYEGIMLKDPKGPYNEGRGKHWLKYKPEETYDAKIVGFYEGREGTKNEGKLGGFIVELENGEELRVGGGLSDTQRERFWVEKGKLKGKWLEFKAQMETNENAVTNKARFGRFVRIREDRS